MSGYFDQSARSIESRCVDMNKTEHIPIQTYPSRGLEYVWGDQMLVNFRCKEVMKQLLLVKIRLLTISGV